jgi:hypothetical protein
VDLDRLRFGDWVMGLGAVAVLSVMFADWYELVLPDDPDVPAFGDDFWFNAWQAFSVVDVILALAAVMALTAVILAATQPTAAVPLAVSSLTTIVAIVALLLVIFRVISPPDLNAGDELEAARLTGAWLGLVATTLLAAGCLASIRDERLPRPEHQAEPRLVKP